MSEVTPAVEVEDSLPRVGLGLMGEREDKVLQALVYLLLGCTLGFAFAVSGQPPPKLLPGDEVPERYVELITPPPPEPEEVEHEPHEEPGEERPMYCGSAPRYDAEGNVVGHKDGYWDPRCPDNPYAPLSRTLLEVMIDKHDPGGEHRRTGAIIETILACNGGDTRAVVRALEDPEGAWSGSCETWGCPCFESHGCYCPFDLDEQREAFHTRKPDMTLARLTRAYGFEEPVCIHDAFDHDREQLEPALQEIANAVWDRDEQIRKRNPNLDGTLELSWTIRYGRAIDLRILEDSTGNEDLVGAITKAIEQADFPRLAKHETHVYCPFALTPLWPWGDTYFSTESSLTVEVSSALEAQLDPSLQVLVELFSACLGPHGEQKPEELERCLHQAAGTMFEAMDPATGSGIRIDIETSP